MYNGPGPYLKRGIAERMKNLLDAVVICGGVDYNFFKQLTANSNQFARNKLDHHQRFCGFPWKNITTEEMYCFFLSLIEDVYRQLQVGWIQSIFQGEAYKLPE